MKNFIELTDRNVPTKSLFNLNEIVEIQDNKEYCTIYLGSHDNPVEVKEAFEEIKQKLSN